MTGLLISVRSAVAFTTESMSSFKECGRAGWLGVYRSRWRVRPRPLGQPDDLGHYAGPLFRPTGVGSGGTDLYRRAVDGMPPAIPATAAGRPAGAGQEQGSQSN